MKMKKKCHYCNKKFEGTNENQVETYLNIHLITKHKDLVEISEKQKK